MSMLRIIHGGAAGALVSAGAALIVLIFARGLGGLSLSPLIFLLFIGGAAIVGAVIQRALVASAGTIADSVLLPSGNSTAYTPTFSHIEALEIRGDLKGAALAWDEACGEHPSNALVWVKSADFHLRTLADPVAALARYRHVRDLPNAHSDNVRYASQKLVDLYLGPLSDEGRAMVELRRLIERFPDTREAGEARAALSRLKAERPRD